MKKQIAEGLTQHENDFNLKNIIVDLKQRHQENIKERVDEWIGNQFEKTIRKNLQKDIVKDIERKQSMNNLNMLKRVLTGRSKMVKSPEEIDEILNEISVEFDSQNSVSYAYEDHLVDKPTPVLNGIQKLQGDDSPKYNNFELKEFQIHQDL